MPGGAQTGATGCDPCSISTNTCGTTDLSHNIAPTSTPCNPDENGEYQPENYLTPMAGKIMPMRKVFQDQFRGIADYFFDYDTTVNDKTGKMDTNLVFKNFPNMQLGDFYDGNYITRGERYFKPLDFFVTQDYGTPVLTFQVGLKNNNAIVPGLGSDYTSGGQGNLTAGDTVMIYQNDPSDADPDCCENMVVKTITAVDAGGSTITLEGPGGITLKEGDRIKKLYHGRNDCQPITYKFGIIPSTAKRSYVQHFGYEIEFKKGELNKAYATPREAMDFVANRIYHANLDLVRQMAFTAYFGRNRGEITNSGQVVPAETQGIISGIMQANALNPSLEAITSLHLATTDDAKVRHILDELLKVQASGMMDTGETIDMVCNQQALNALLKMNNAWNKFTGFTVNRNDNVNKDFTLPVIQTPNGNTQLKFCKILSELYPNEGVIVFVPTKLIGIKARRNAMYDYTTGAMKTSTLGITIKETTSFKQHECRTFDVFTEMAILIQGLDSGAFRMIQGLKASC